jgi:hypothetical protein
LLALGAEFARVDGRLTAMDAALMARTPGAISADDPAFIAVHDHWWALIDRVTALPAHTSRAQAAKAAVALGVFRGCSEAEGGTNQAALSLLRDLTGQNGPSPDAELIRLCADHIANRHAYNTSGNDLEADDDPLWHAYVRTRDAIHDAEPATIAGVIAKARAAKAESVGAFPGSAENPRGTPAADWAWDLVNDLLRLNGA